MTIVKTVVVPFLGFSLWATGALAECENFSHFRPTGVGVTVTYRQIGCEKFLKLFIDEGTGELLLTEEAPFSSQWKETFQDTPSDTYTVKQRFVLSSDGKALFEDLIVDGKAKLPKRLRSFYRTRSEVLKKLPGGEIEKTGFEFHRYEYGDGSIESEHRSIRDQFQPAPGSPDVPGYP